MPESKQIQSMFSKVANQYDRANDVLSLGIHHLWRKKVVNWSGASPGQKVLDCATGTGDLAIEFKKAVGPEGEVVGTDFCPEMLESAPSKAKMKQLAIQFSVADVMSLPYENQRFDISSISFGIRNVENPTKALKEMARVTRPGGKVVVLEFGRMETPIVGPLYHFYSEKILPKIGGWVTGQPEAYDYLQKSSAAFPSKKEFVDLMMGTGSFSEVKNYTLSFGIAYAYIGTVKN